MTKSYVCVSGYGWSGSGLIVDYLRSMDGFSALGFEFSLIKEPKGLLDLEYSLIENWDVLRSHFALEDFKKYCNVLNRKNRKFGAWGLAIERELQVDFLGITDEFMENISEFSYSGKTRVQEYYLSNFRSFYRKIRRRVSPSDVDSKAMFFCKPDRQLFVEEVRIYLSRLFERKFEDEGSKYLILDQAIPTTNSLRALNYFNSPKLIIVDRDPRDIYVDLIQQDVLIGSASPGIERAQKYVLWHRRLREQKAAESPNILHVNFEDLILNYGSTSKLIEDLLEESLVRSGVQSFNTSESHKNIGLWKKFPYGDEIRFIEENLLVKSYD